MGRVLVLGSLNVDLVARVERLPGPGETVSAIAPIQRLAGGKGGNQALAAASAGARVVMIGAVGDDEPGRAYTVRLSGRGVFPRLAIAFGVPTGTAYVWVDETGENSIVVAPGANAHARAEVADLTPEDVLLCQLEVPVDVVAQAVRTAARLGARVVLNAAPYAALPDDVLAIADPLVVNEHEAGLLADSGAVPRSLLVTFGAAGRAGTGSGWTAYRCLLTRCATALARETRSAGRWPHGWPRATTGGPRWRGRSGRAPTRSDARVPRSTRRSSRRSRRRGPGHRA
jgi:ribokinase